MTRALLPFTLTFLAAFLAGAAACTDDAAPTAQNSGPAATPAAPLGMPPGVPRPPIMQGNAPPAAPPGYADAAGATNFAGIGTPYDRIVVLPKDGMTPEAIQSVVERATGQKLKFVGTAMGKWLLLHFAPTAKGRSTVDQEALVAAVRQLPELEAAEREQPAKIR